MSPVTRLMVVCVRRRSARSSSSSSMPVGEAAPLESYDGVPMAAVRAALDAYGQVLAERGDAPLEDLLEACRAELADSDGPPLTV